MAVLKACKLATKERALNRDASMRNVLCCPVVTILKVVHA